MTSRGYSTILIPSGWNRSYYSICTELNYRLRSSVQGYKEGTENQAFDICLNVSDKESFRKFKLEIALGVTKSNLWWLPLPVLLGCHLVVMAKRILKLSDVVEGDVFVSSSLLEKCHCIFPRLAFPQCFIFIWCHFKVSCGKFGKHLLKCCLKEHK